MKREEVKALLKAQKFIVHSDFTEGDFGVIDSSNGLINLTIDTIRDEEFRITTYRIIDNDAVYYSEKIAMQVSRKNRKLENLENTLKAFNETYSTVSKFI